MYEDARDKEGVSHPLVPPDLDCRISSLQTQLGNLGRELGWGRGRRFPNVKFIAETTNSLSEYEVFYHAASGSVHANTHHLGRIFWGDAHANKFSISNRNFNNYSYFVLMTLWRPAGDSSQR
jgi:hypothetical protein